MIKKKKFGNCVERLQGLTEIYNLTTVISNRKKKKLKIIVLDIRKKINHGIIIMFITAFLFRFINKIKIIKSFEKRLGTHLIYIKYSGVSGEKN